MTDHTGPLVIRSTRDRGLGGDIARVSQRIPLFPVERTMSLASVAAARDTATERVGWATIFLKAYALVAREMPELRTWLARRGGLLPQLVTAPYSVGTLAINRHESGHERLFFIRITHPETRTLAELQQVIHDHAARPIAELFKRQAELELVPGPLRRAILWWNMQSASPKRATRLGTFSLSTLAGLGATNRMHPTLCATSLSYAPLEADGRCVVTLICDHRVLDGATAARALQWLEQALTSDIVAELSGHRDTIPTALVTPSVVTPSAALPEAGQRAAA
jgi:hypothetical protein